LIKTLKFDELADNASPVLTAEKTLPTTQKQGNK
jgi:hypothetical protein